MLLFDAYENFKKDLLLILKILYPSDFGDYPVVVPWDLHSVVFPPLLPHFFGDAFCMRKSISSWGGLWVKWKMVFELRSSRPNDSSYFSVVHLKGAPLLTVSAVWRSEWANMSLKCSPVFCLLSLGCDGSALIVVRCRLSRWCVPGFREEIQLQVD